MGVSSLSFPCFVYPRHGAKEASILETLKATDTNSLQQNSDLSTKDQERANLTRQKTVRQ